MLENPYQTQPVGRSQFGKPTQFLGTRPAYKGTQPQFPDSAAIEAAVPQAVQDLQEFSVGQHGNGLGDCFAGERRADQAGKQLCFLAGMRSRIGQCLCAERGLFAAKVVQNRCVRRAGCQWLVPLVQILL